MCGIIGVIVKDGSKINDRLKEIYEGQQYRGQQGAGFAVGRAGQIRRVRFRAPKKALKFAKRITFQPGDLLLFHHRYPTSTPNSPAFNHPIANEDESIMLIHNGHISNSAELLSKLGEKHQFETLLVEGKQKDITDSEVIIHLLEENLPAGGISGALGGIVDAFKATADGLAGSFAIAVLMGGVIYLFRKGNPIVVYSDAEGNVWFSSVLPDGKDYTMLRAFEDGELGLLDARGYTQLKIFEDMKPKPAVFFDYDTGDFGVSAGYYYKPAAAMRRYCSICGEETTGGKYCEYCWGFMKQRGGE
jgi:glucosamine--fructose-6-phosphate aminotransferase (isomerizing)